MENCFFGSPVVATRGAVDVRQLVYERGEYRPAANPECAGIDRHLRQVRAAGNAKSVADWIVIKPHRTIVEQVGERSTIRKGSEVLIGCGDIASDA